MSDDRLSMAVRVLDRGEGIISLLYVLYVHMIITKQVSLVNSRSL